MNCPCYVCQQVAAGISEQYCSQCGLAKFGSIPQPVNPNVCTHEKPNVLFTNLAEKESWHMKTDSHSIWDACSISDHKTLPFNKNECFTSDLSTQCGTMSLAPSERDNRRPSSLKSGFRCQTTYSVPTFRYDSNTENEERLRETQKSNHLAALEIEADALQATRHKIRYSLAEEKGRKNMTSEDKRKKERNLAIVKQNEMEIIQAMERRRLAEQETAAILQRQEIDALEFTRRAMQLEAAKRRREEELVGIQWRRREAELAADEATTRRQALDDYLQLFHRPCYHPIVTNENVYGGIASDISNNMDAIVGSDDQRLSQATEGGYIEEGLCYYCQHISTTINSADKFYSSPPKLSLSSTPPYEKKISKSSEFEEIPNRSIVAAESELMRELMSHRSIPKLDSQELLPKSTAISRTSLAAAGKSTDTLPVRMTMEDMTRQGISDEEIRAQALAKEIACRKLESRTIQRQSTYKSSLRNRQKPRTTSVVSMKSQPEIREISYNDLPTKNKKKTSGCSIQ